LDNPCENRALAPTLEFGAQTEFDYMINAPRTSFFLPIDDGQGGYCLDKLSYTLLNTDTGKEVSLTQEPSISFTGSSLSVYSTLYKDKLVPLKLIVSL
jgi:hypothetical protein